MKTKISSLANRIKKAAFFIPFTIYFAVFALALFVVQSFLYSNKVKNDSSFSDIFALLLKVALAFSAFILFSSLVFVLISWIHFIYWKKKTGTDLRIDTASTPADQADKQTVQLRMRPVLKPLFGFIKMRLQYDQQGFSDKFSLLESGSRSLFNKTLEGHYHWHLPEIKEYRLEKAIVYFEDIFQFFSLAVSLPANSQFFKYPAAGNAKQLNVSPRKTEDTNTRIDQMRKVEGEFLNYKNFENNDDVRRIVWKIYAKNKELVVRIPEIMDPYASHVYLYPSFHTNFTILGNETVEIPFLNFYKIVTWSVYESLVKQGFEVKYIPDQDVAKSYTANEKDGVRYAISTAKWQDNKDLKSFVQTNVVSVIIISSLSNAAQVKELADRHGKDIRFIFVKLTDSFQQQNLFDWVQWIFVKNEQQDMDIYKRKWAISFLKEKIKQNEKQLEDILEDIPYRIEAKTVN